MHFLCDVIILHGDMIIFPFLHRAELGLLPRLFVIAKAAMYKKDRHLAV